MHRVHVAIEVGPLDSATIERLKGDGYAVFRGKTTWRVERTEEVVASSNVTAQAHAFVVDTVRRYRLPKLTDPPVYVLHDPDAGLDDRPDLIIDDARRAANPDPLRNPLRRWFQTERSAGGIRPRD